MGLAASQARFLQLTARQSDLEFQGQQVNQQRMNNSYAMQALSTSIETQLQSDAANNINPQTDPTYLADNATLTSDQAIDSQFEQQLKNIDTLHTEVQTEIDSVKKVIDKNIDQTFKTFA